MCHPLIIPPNSDRIASGQIRNQKFKWRTEGTGMFFPEPHFLSPPHPDHAVQLCSRFSSHVQLAQA